MAILKMLALSVAAVVSVSFATPPAGYVKEPDTDESPPKYEFAYDVQDGKGGRQGHIEARDGIYARGVYYANLPDGFTQKVEYYVDDWGYHPKVSYTRTDSKQGSSESTVETIGPAKGAAVPAQPVIVSNVQKPDPVYNTQSDVAAALYQKSSVGGSNQPPQSSSKHANGQEHALFFKISDSSQVSSSANQIDGSSANQVSYSGYVDHGSDYQQGGQSGNSEASSQGYGYQGISSQSESDSGSYVSSTVAPVVSNLVIQQPQVTYQDNYGATGDSDLYNKESLSPVISTLVVQQPPASYKINYEEGGLSNSYNEVSGPSIVSSTPSTLTVVRQPQENYQGNDEINVSNSYNEQSGSVTSSTPSSLTKQSRVVHKQRPQSLYQQSYGVSGVSNLYNQVTSSTLSPLEIAKQTQLAYEESFGGSVDSNSYNEVSGPTISSTLTVLPQISYQQRYTESSTSNSYNQISGSTVTSTPATFFKVVKKPEVVYEESYVASDSSSNYEGSSAPAVIAQQPNIGYGDIYRDFRTSGYYGGVSSNVASQQPPVSYPISEAKSTGGNVFRVSSAPIRSSGQSDLQKDTKVHTKLFIPHINGALEFGARIKPGNRDSIVTTVSPPTLTTSYPHEYLQYDSTRHHKDKYSISVTPPTLTRSSLKPIVVADFVTHPPVVTPKSKYSTPAPSYFSSASSNSGSSYLENTLYSESVRDNSHGTPIQPISVKYNTNSVAGSNYIVSSTAAPIGDTVLITPRPELIPVPSALVASSENIPQISMTPPRSSSIFQSKNKVKSVSSTTPAPDNQKVEENPPKISTIVEVQKSIPVEIPYGNVGIPGKSHGSNIPTVSNQIQIDQINQINNEFQSQINKNVNQVEKENQAQLGGTQLLLQTYLEDQQAREQANIQQILLAQLQSQSHLLQQQQASHVQIANMQALLQALELENKHAEVETKSKVQSLTKPEVKGMKEALITTLTQSSKEGNLKVVDKMKPLQQASIQQLVGYSGTKQAGSNLRPISNTFTGSTPWNEGTSSNTNYTSKLIQPSFPGFVPSTQLGTFLNQVNTGIYQLHEKPTTEFNQESQIRAEKGNEYALESISHPLIHYNHNLVSTNLRSQPEHNYRYSQPLPEINDESEPQRHIDYKNITNTEQNSHSAYTQYYNDAQQLQSGHQLYQSADVQNYGISQSNVNRPSEFIQQELEPEKEQGVIYIPQVYDTGAREPTGQFQLSLEPPNEPVQDITLQEPAPQQMKYLEVQKPVFVPHPVPVEHTKYVEVPKPVPVPHPVAVEVTKLIPIDRPLPYPQPYAVPQPVPVPIHVPHTVQVPVAHVVRVPQYVHVPVKQYHPVYIQGKPPKVQSPITGNFKYKDNLYRGLHKQAPYGIPRYAPYNTRKPLGHSHVFRVAPVPGRGRYALGSMPYGHMRMQRMDQGGFKPIIAPSKLIKEPAPVREVQSKIA